MRKGLVGLVVTFLTAAAAVHAQPPAAMQPPELIPPPREVVPPAPADAPSFGIPFGLAEGDPDPTRFWGEAEYLIWWVKEATLPPPLLTTGPAGSFGILGNPGTTVLAGQSEVDYGRFFGGRFTLGSWLGQSRIFGVEANGFFLNEESAHFGRFSNAAGTPLLARPIVNAATLTETAITLASPGGFSGGLNATSSSQLWGAEVNGLVNLIRQGRTGIDLLVGFRYLDLEEHLDLSSRTTPLPGGFAFFAGNPVLGPNAVAITDQFATRNQFYGGQIGGRGRVQRGRLSADFVGKVAFGVVHQAVRAAGSTALLAPDGTVTAQARGGLLALPTNIGRRTENDGAVVPELGVRFGFDLTSRLTFHAGYTIVYFDNVVRPGDQVSRTVNLTQVPASAAFGPLAGPSQPAPLFNDSRFWAQGVNVGLAFRY